MAYLINHAINYAYIIIKKERLSTKMYEMYH